MVSILLSIIDYKEKHHTLSKGGKDTRREISSLLLSFKKSRLPILFKSAEFLTLTVEYLNLPDIIPQLLKGRSDRKLKIMYNRHLFTLKKECIDKLAHYNS
mmetsp:Transcript_10744/g.9463  ORF Transcript_10744/g.9463 Transcript_10744/m.9463 type:complete len:101 (+) Transcript_10744:841-1143(+)